MKPALHATLGILAAISLCLPACGGGGGGGSRTIPAATSPPSTMSQSAFGCPSGDGTSSLITAGGASEATRRAPARVTTAAQTAAFARIAVTYDRAAYGRASAAFAAREESAGGTLVRGFDYDALGKVVRVLAVPAAQMSAAMASLRDQSGVIGVTQTGQRRFATTAPANLVNNHYFDGFPPANTPPYYESAAIPGQWDMHAILLEHAFGYPGALGSHAVKIAIVDTGEDTLHPDLAANVVYQKCFITSTNGVQSVGAFSTDPNGHGTDVAGIAAAVTNSSSGLGFAGAGGNTAIMAYRVFPTPDDNCTNPSSSDSQCGADTVDIASAIDDAVQNGAKVISLSLGAAACVPPGPNNPGGDSDIVEGTAVENAIANNVIVVAASGNSSTASVESPGCDTGVIAVGATSLDDGTANGSGHSGGTPASPVEYVASYSNYGSPASSAGCTGGGCAGAWGIVAPGGDPSGSSDSDDLHWIENIWTSTPFDNKFAGTCTSDFGTTSAPDCRILIAGTSQATPHVSGVAALVCSLNAAYCTPAAMKQLLCGTAHDIGDPHQGCGRLDAYLAVATAVNDPSPPAR